MFRTSRFIFSPSIIVTILVFGCFLLAFVVASIYQASQGSSILAETARNVDLREVGDQATVLDGRVSSLTFAEIQSNYRDSTTDQWRIYALGVLGKRVEWSGKVTAIDLRRVEIDMGSSPLRYLYLLDLDEDQNSILNIGDAIQFEGRLQSFHLMKGMNIVLDNVLRINP